MTKSTITREQQRQILIDTAQHIISRDNTSPYSENLREIARIALAAIDSEPVAWKVRFKLEGQPGSNFNKFFENRRAMNDVVSLHELGGFNIDVTPLYRHAQPAAVVPDDVLDALQKVARIHLDLNDFDGDRRGIADCLGDAEEALIEVVNRRAAMLNGGNDE
ncbi:TPA: hypothetical protein IB025_001391 [Escherichia coli]|nr:hypothetical protein [Escherichia coli]